MALLAHAAVHPQLPVYVKRLVRLDLHLPNPLTRCHTLINGRLELIAPRTPPAVSIAVVIAAQEIALGLRALLDGERDINGFEEVFFELGVQADNVVDILLDVLGVQTAEEVAGPC